MTTDIHKRRDRMYQRLFVEYSAHKRDFLHDVGSIVRVVTLNRPVARNPVATEIISRHVQFVAYQSESSTPFLDKTNDELDKLGRYYF